MHATHSTHTSTPLMLPTLSLNPQKHATHVSHASANSILFSKLLCCSLVLSCESLKRDIYRPTPRIHTIHRNLLYWFCLLNKCKIQQDTLFSGLIYFLFQFFYVLALHLGQKFFTFYRLNFSSDFSEGWKSNIANEISLWKLWGSIIQQNLNIYTMNPFSVFRCHEEAV